MLNIDFKKFDTYYDEIKKHYDKDNETHSMWQDMLLKAFEYTTIRVEWPLMTAKERAEKDLYRSACHNSFINNLKMYVRYLKQLGIELEVNELIEQDRQIIGDFANYLIFREAVNNR